MVKHLERTLSIHLRIRMYIWIIIISPFTCAYATTLTVCPTCPLSSISQAIESSIAFDSIIIELGTYHESGLIISHPLFVIGKGEAIINSLEGEEILTIISDSVSIIGLHFKNVTTSYLKERAAIRIKDHKHFIVRDNYFEDCFFGIYLEHASFGSIMNNTISGNATSEAESGNGIHAWYCSKLSIINNEITGHRDGLYFEFVNKSLIRENRSHDNRRYGLHFMFSNDDVYENNTFNKNGVGVAVMFSRRIKMSNNVFTLSWGRSSYGLLLKEIYDADIHNNQFIKNTMGIFVEGSNRVTYKNNTFIQNGWAIHMSGGCEENIISHNDFLNNSLDLVVSSQLNDNEIKSNYWSEYSGYDLNYDGIGDVPHYPVKLFSHILNQVPEAIILIRSTFVEILNFTEKVSPIFTPKNVFDPSPLMVRAND